MRSPFQNLSADTIIPWNIRGWFDFWPCNHPNELSSSTRIHTAPKRCCPVPVEITQNSGDNYVVWARNPQLSNRQRSAALYPEDISGRIEVWWPLRCDIVLRPREERRNIPRHRVIWPKQNPVWLGGWKIRWSCTSAMKMIQLAEESIVPSWGNTIPRPPESKLPLEPSALTIFVDNWEEVMICKKCSVRLGDYR